MREERREERKGRINRRKRKGENGRRKVKRGEEGRKPEKIEILYYHLLSLSKTAHSFN